MNILRDVARELLGMFLADVQLATGTLTLVALVAVLVLVVKADPLFGGCLLLLGCLVVLVSTAILGARRRETQ